MQFDKKCSIVKTVQSSEGAVMAASLEDIRIMLATGAFPLRDPSPGTQIVSKETNTFVNNKMQELLGDTDKENEPPDE